MHDKPAVEQMTQNNRIWKYLGEITIMIHKITTRLYGMS